MPSSSPLFILFQSALLHVSGFIFVFALPSVCLVCTLFSLRFYLSLSLFLSLCEYNIYCRWFVSTTAAKAAVPFVASPISVFHIIYCMFYAFLVVSNIKCQISVEIMNVQGNAYTEMFPWATLAHTSTHTAAVQLQHDVFCAVEVERQCIAIKIRTKSDIGPKTLKRI